MIQYHFIVFVFIHFVDYYVRRCLKNVFAKQSCLIVEEKMASITEIKAKICQLSPAQFQEYCDDFLYRKGYRNIHSLGMKPGTGNTTKGNPDTYFLKDNGKYVFVVYTIQQTGLYNKILDDIEKCLDPSKTGLPITEIDEIICCHASSNLSAGDDYKLRERCKKEGITLTIYGVDEIAAQTQADYPSLASKYLHLNINTNQLVSLEDFVRQYDANKLAAPLETDFIFRIKEKEEVISGLCDYEVVILYGKSGVGKTRLALEAAKAFSIDKNYRLICVKNNYMSLYEDLCSLTEQPGDYLLFIDDANELEFLREVFSFINLDNPRFHVKLLLTVRDYARKNVVSIVKRSIEPLLYEIERFTDQEIKAFLEQCLGIRNESYLQQIVRIAEGNPRIAFMAGKLAKEPDKLRNINDASALYDEYYSTYVDDTIGKDRDLCLTAGILSVVNAVVLCRLDVLEDVFTEGIMTSSSFVNKIQLLSNYEVVEIMNDQVASISDQCLANYMIYYVFFKQKLIPFSLILEIGYKHFHDGVIKSINTILNIYNNQETREYCRQEVLEVWKAFAKNGDSCYNSFILDFHTFNPEESFIFAEESINKIAPEIFNPFKSKEEQHQFDSNSDLLSFLEGYENSDYIDNVIELLVNYCSKSERAMSSGCEWLKHKYGVDRYSLICKYNTQQKVSDALSSSLAKNSVYARFICYEWIKYSLDFIFEAHELTRDNKFLLYRISIIETEELRRYREVCFDSLISILAAGDDSDLGLDFLTTYVNSLHDDTNSVVVEGDMLWLEKIITELQCNKIQYLSALERLIRYADQHHIQYDSNWKSFFDDEKWSLFKLLRDDYHMSGLEYEAYQEARLSRIQVFGKTLKCDAIKSLTDNVNAILSESFIGRNDYFIKNGFEIVLQGLSFDCLLKFLEEFFVNGNAISIRPGVVLTSLLKNMNSQQVYELITSREFNQKNDWLFSFFEELPNKDVDTTMKDELLSFLKDDSDREICISSLRRLRLLDKFKDVEPCIYPIACKIIFDKKAYNKFMVFIYFELLFNEHVYTPKELLDLFSSDIELLQDIYFFMISNGKLDDYKGVFLKEFILLGDDWLEKYAPIFWEKASHYGSSETLRCAQLWESDNYMEYYNYLFYNFPEGEMHAWKLEQAFKNSINNKDSSELVKKHQNEWIRQIIIDNAFDEKIKLVFKVIRGLDEKTRREAIRQFLEINEDYEIFSSISFMPNFFEGTNSIIPAYKKQIDFIESLFPLVKGMKFIKHKALLVSRIEEWKEIIKKREIEETCNKLYN